MLRIGALAPLGLSLPTLLASQEARGAGSSGSFGKAKRCLLLFMWGGPAHQDLWDMKPLAPANVRGEFKPIRSNVPGMHVCEHLPHLSKQMDKLALVRSVTHTDNNHSTGAHWMLTGHKHTLSAENFGASPNDFPQIGSVISKLAPGSSNLPTFVALPELIATTAGAVVPGQNGGRLGKQYDPLRIDQHPDEPNFKVATLSLPDDMNPVRVDARLNLLDSFNTGRRDLEMARQIKAMRSYQGRAADLLTSTQAGQAFNLAAESDRERDRYGRQTFGQSVLLARRLLEAGVKLVTVYWHRDKPGVDTTWDTHGDNFKQLKNRLIPQVDRPIATLLEDLQQRGLLDETLVVWMSEFGRTPTVNAAAGRDHWGPCNTIWMAGGGVPGGQVFGASDKHAAFPANDPVSPSDVAATIYHLLGIDSHAFVHDRENRPHVISHGKELIRVLSGECPPRDDDALLPKPPTEVPPNAELLADKPLAYWRLAESTAAPARDEVGASPEKPAGLAPGAYLGNPASGDQRLSATISDWSEKAYTVEFCFRNTLAYDQSAVTGYMFGRVGANVGSDRARGEHVGIAGTYPLHGDNRGKLFVFNGDNSERGSVVGRTVLELGRWTHVALCRDGEQVTLYLNGQTDRPEIQGPLAKLFTTNQLFVAARQDALFPFQGQMHDVAIFNGLLAKERVAAHYQASVAAKG